MDTFSHASWFDKENEYEVADILVLPNIIIIIIIYLRSTK